MSSTTANRSSWTRTSILATLGGTLFFSLVIPLVLEINDLSPLSSGSGWVLAAVPMALISSMLIRELGFRLQFRATTKMALVLLYAIAAFAPSWLSTAIVLNSIGGGHRWLEAYVSFLAYASVFSGFAWIVANTIGAARAATRVSNRLENTLAAEQDLNELVEAAEHRRFLNYQSTIHSKVSRPLYRVLKLNEKYSSEKLAQQLELFQAKEMRPLSHQLHPVTVKVGLAPAIRSLGPVFQVRMSEELKYQDSQGALVDEHVRQQIFRWIQELTPKRNFVEVDLRVENATLLISAAGVECFTQLDPIAQVAGLAVRCDSAIATMVLHAPLLGQVQDLEEAPVVGKSSRLPLNWHEVKTFLTLPPYVPLSLILLSAVMTSPINFNVLRSSPLDAERPFILLTVLGIVIPLVIGLPLHLFARYRFTSPKPWQVVAFWVALGILSGLVNNLAVYIIAPEKSLLVAGLVRMLGSFLKFTVVGLLFAATRGYLDQQDRDVELLESAIDASNQKRVQLLAGADETDRYLSEALHRTIQGRLSAIALLFRLDRREEALNELSELCSVTIPGIEQRLIQALLPQESPQLPVPEAQTGLKVQDDSSWGDLFERSQQITSQLQRVVQECEVNAQRHGKATQLVVLVSESQGLWTVKCVDNGQGPSRLAQPGLGSNLFDELCAHYPGEWSLQRINGETVFTLHIQTM